MEDVLCSHDLALDGTQEGAPSVVGVAYRDDVLHVVSRSTGSEGGDEYVYLRNPQTGAVVEREYSITYFYPEDWHEGHPCQESDWDKPEVLYTDSAFYLPEEQLDAYRLWMQYSLSDWSIRGGWTLSFAMPGTLATSALEADTSVPCKGFGVIDRVTVTPFSIGLHVHDRGEEYWDHQPAVAVVYRDGRTRDYSEPFVNETWDSAAQLDQGISTRTAIGSVEDYESIVALIIDGTRVDL